MTDATTQATGNTFGEERIAYRSTRGGGAFKKKRWSEFAVFFRHQPDIGGHRFRVEIKGCSTHLGETDRTKSFTCPTLDDALLRLDDSAPARRVAEEARLWVQFNPEVIAPTQTQPATDQAALALLYGDDAAAARGIIARVAADFGMAESTVRMALSNGTPLRVPLRAAVLFMDANAFRRVSADRAARSTVEKANG